MNNREAQLSELWNGFPVPLPNFFRLAIQLIQRLAIIRLNDKRPLIISMDSIRVNSESLELIHWEIQPYSSTQTTVSKGWIHTAPELTGKTRRVRDERTDFYLLGLIFYPMLTGAYPFEAEGKSEWIHAHLTRTPTPAYERHGDVPRGLSLLIDKLLAKTAENRYQTIKCLELDMQHCQNEYTRTGQIAPFPLAERERRTAAADISAEVLYGRDQELSRIGDAFKWTTLGSTQMIGVTGPPGIGKTALIQQAIRRIALGQAYVVSGKFDAFQRDSPMSPLINAFQELADQLLNEDKQNLKNWKDSILQSLGLNAAVIAEVIPSIERIIGKQAPVESLPPEESVERFRFVFRRFIQVFCNQKHPLVLFLDDLQWADAASWRMIRSFMTDPQSQNLLLIGAFRNDENSPMSLIQEELETMASSGVSVQTLTLAPLTHTDLTRIISSTLYIEDHSAEEVAYPLFLKSDGNPFLFHQWFHMSLYEEMLRYDDRIDRWVWSEKENKVPLDPVHVDLLLNYMTDSINRLPIESRHALLEASCLGGESLIAVLSTIRQEAPDRTLEVLQPAIDRQLIVRTDERKFRFFHDRVREAAYSLLEPTIRENIHWQAGLYWSGLEDPDVRERHLFDAAGHLNKGSRLARSPSDGERLVHANAIAGRKAKSATAYEAAVGYFQAAVEHISEAYWERDFDFCFELHVGLLECEYMNGWRSSTEVLFHNVLRRGRNALERTRVQQIAINRLLHTTQMSEGIALGIACLHDLGIRVSEKPGKLALLTDTLLTREQLRRKVGRLKELPPVADSTVKVALHILTLISAAAYLTDKLLFCSLICKSVRLSLRYGNSPLSAMTYGNFGAFLSLATGDIPLGRAALREGLQIAQAHNQPSVLCRAHLSIGAMFFIMDDPEGRDFNFNLQTSIQNGLEAGDLLFVGHAVCTRIINMHITGNLVQAKAVIPECLEMLSLTQNHHLHLYVNIFEQLVSALQVGDEDAITQNDDLLHRIRHAGMDQVLLFQYGLCRLQEGYLLGEWEKSLEGAELANIHENAAFHYLQLSEYYLIHGLTLTTRSLTPSSGERKRLTHYIRMLRRWARKCPEHIRHKSLLLMAEHARIRGKVREAAVLYDDAIREARNSGYVHHVAIACECAGQFYMSQSRESMAKGYIIEAYMLYRRWGAARKAELFRQRYADQVDILSLVTSDAAMPRELLTAAAAVERPAIPDALDMSIVQEAFQSMADESDQPRLIEKLVRTVMEYAGAQRGCFIMERTRRLHVELSVDQDGNVHREHIPLERYEEACLPAIRYSVNTGDSVVLEHAAMKGRFARDPYVMSCQTQSLLCLPVQLHNRLTGVLYLENNMLPGAFTVEQLELLRMLATQTLFLLKLFPSEHAQTDQIEEGTNEDEFAELGEQAEGLGIQLDPLTKRELEILQLMSLGMSNQEIASQLHIAVGTVKLHTNRIFSKMNVNRRAKAVLEAKRMKWLPADSKV